MKHKMSDKHAHRVTDKKKQDLHHNYQKSSNFTSPKVKSNQYV